VQAGLFFFFFFFVGVIRREKLKKWFQEGAATLLRTPSVETPA
jgi:hypothetical protein